MQLGDFDPDKRTIVMIHGLGGSPLAWARLSDAIRSDPALGERFQLGTTGDGYFLQARLNVSPPGVARDVAQRLIDTAHQICPRE